MVTMILGIASCSDDLDHQNEQPDPNLRPQILYNGRYLEFASQDVFDEALEALRNSDADKARQWAKPYGFVSMRMIYEEYLSEELSLLSKADTENANDLSARGPFTKKHENLFIFDSDNNIIGLKTFHFDVSNFLSEEGLVKIAGHIFQYNQDNIKIILRGDPDKISILKDIQSTDEAQQIIVNPIEPINITKRDASVGRYSYSHSKSCEQRPNILSNKYRVVGYIDLTYYSVPIYGDYICDPACGSYPMQNTAINMTTDAQAYLPPDCECYYEIIGYTTRQYYKTNMKVEKTNFWGTWQSFGGAETILISVDWYIDGIKQPSKLIVGGSHTSSLALTIFDGSAMKNVTYGQHLYVAGSNEFGIDCTDTFSD